MFHLNDQHPSLEYMSFFADRYKECDVSALQTYLSVVRLSSRLQSNAEAYFQRMELSQGRFLILMMLLKAGSAGLSPAEIAQNISCARATVTGLLDTLESSDYIERHADPNGDRRSLTIRLTPAGQKKIDSVMPEHHRRIKKLADEFSTEEREQLMHLLTKFSKGLAAFAPITDEKDRT